MILLKNLFNIYLIKKMINKDFKRRRDFLISKIEDNSIVFLFSGLEKSRNNDVNYKFRQSSNFFYLTGINNPSLLFAIDRMILIKSGMDSYLLNHSIKTSLKFKMCYILMNLTLSSLMMLRTCILNSLMITGSTNLLRISTSHNLNRDT